MPCYINASLGYYEGDQISPSDTEVSQRHDHTYAWDGSAWQPTAASMNAPILSEIAALEATVTQRRVREAALTDAGKAWLAGVDSQIAALRTQLFKE